jgi:hypothetical protein
VRRALHPGVLAAAALIPPVVWLFPALRWRQAPSFRDQGDFFYPLKLYTAERLRAGEIPLWNPWSGAGEPWLANAQSGVFYPPTFFFLLPWPGIAGGLFLLFHFAVAVWGMWRFCRDEGVTAPASALAAAVFAASGLAASLSAFWNHFGAFAWMPAILWLARSGLRTRGAAAGCALLIGLQAMAGSPELSAATILLALVFAWFRRAELPGGWRETSPAETRRRGLVAVALGLGLAAWALLPMTELAIHSQRRAPFAADLREMGAVRAGAVASLLGAGEDPAGNFFFASLFLGPIPLAAAAAAFAERQRRGLIALLAAAGAIGLLVALAGPPGSWIRELPGLDRIRYPAKALTVSLFCLAALSGIGLDALRFLGDRRARIVLALAAGAGGLAVVALSRQPGPVRAATVVGIAALVLLAAIRTESASAGAALAGVAMLSLVAAFALVNLAVFRFVPGEEIRRVPESSTALARLPGRVLTPTMGELAPWVTRDWAFDSATVRRQRESLLGYTNLLSGVRTLRTAAALPTRGAGRIAEAIDDGPDPARAAGAASGRTFWTPFSGTGGETSAGRWRRASIEPFRPRIALVARYEIERDADRAWSRAAEGGDGGRVFLDREPSPRPEPAGRYAIAQIAEESAERVVAGVSSDAAGILVLTDLSYPGWRAKIDGRPADLLRADGLFRAVSVPAGEHRVEFRYVPVSFFAGAAVSAVSLAGLLVWLCRRPRPAGGRA